MSESADAIVVGGGFYGVVIARHLAQAYGLRRVVILEQASALLTRASRVNQARVHCGYHYPRSFVTAYRSRVNLPRFSADWQDAVKRDFTKVYAIAREGSRVTANQFERFCQTIGAPLRTPAAEVQALFDSRRIERVFEVDEYAFDYSVLADWARRELDRLGVEVRYGAQVKAVSHDGQRLWLEAETEARQQSFSARMVFNCTYSGLNQLAGASVRTKLKHEITEMALVQMPEALAGLGVTVMDGPFFSAMPYPARGLHTLSHVRYTPHVHWQDEAGTHPYDVHQCYAKVSRFERMVRDSARLMPGLLQARWRDSLFEVKTVLTRSEGDDGRPILFEAHADLPGCYSVLGGKIDNVYDILARIDAEPAIRALT